MMGSPRWAPFALAHPTDLPRRIQTRLLSHGSDALRPGLRRFSLGLAGEGRELAAEAVEFIVAGEVDDDPSFAAGRLLQVHFRPQRTAKFLF